MSDFFSVSGQAGGSTSGGTGAFARQGSPSGGDFAGAGGIDTLERTGRRVSMLERYAPRFVTSSPAGALAMAEGAYDDDEMLRSAVQTQDFADVRALGQDLTAESPEIAYALWASLPTPLQESLQRLGYGAPSAPERPDRGSRRFGLNLPDILPGPDELTLPDEGLAGATLGNLQHAAGEVLEGARDVATVALGPFDWLGEKANQTWRTGMFMASHGQGGLQNPLETASQVSNAWRRVDEDNFYVQPGHISRSLRLLGGDRTLYRMAKGTARGFTPEEMVADFGFEIGSPEAGQLVIALTEAQQTPEFTRAVSMLSSGQLSFGRVVAQGVGVDDTTSGWGAILSGTLDGGFTIINDPTLVAGAVSRGARFGRWAFTLEDGRDLNAAHRMVDIADELNTARNAGTATEASRVERLRGAGRIGGTDIGRGRATLAWADRVAEGFATGQLSRLMRDMPNVTSALDTMMRSHLARPTAGLPDLSTTEGVLGWLRSRQGVLGVAGTRLGGTSQLAQGLRMPAYSRTDRAVARTKDWWTRGIDWASAQYGPTLRDMSNAAEGGRFRRAAQQFAVARTVGDAGRLLTGLTAHAPYVRDHIPLYGNEAVEEFGRLVNAGAFARMDRPTLDAYVDNFARGGPQQRSAQVLAFLNELFASAGVSDTDFARNFIERNRQVYAAGGADRMTINGVESRGARLVDAQHADAMATPDLRDFLKATQRTNLVRSMFNNTPASWADSVIGRAWKPAVLMRIGFIPRAAGEELLHFVLKHGPGSYVGAKGAEWHAAEELSFGLDDDIARARDLGDTDALNRLQQQKARTVGSAAPVRSLLAASNRMYLRAFDGFTARMGLTEETSPWRRRLVNKRTRLDETGVVTGLEQFAVSLALRQGGLLEWGAAKARIPSKGAIGEFLATNFNPWAATAARDLLENETVARAYAEQISGSTFTPDEFRGVTAEDGRPMRRMHIIELQGGRPAVREVEMRTVPGMYEMKSRGLSQDPTFMDSLYSRHQQLRGDRAGRQVIQRVLPRWVGGDTGQLAGDLGVADMADLRRRLNGAWAYAPPGAPVSDDAAELAEDAPEGTWIDDDADPDRWETMPAEREGGPAAEPTHYTGRQMLSAVRAYLDGETFEGGRRVWLEESLTRLFDDSGAAIDGGTFLHAIDRRPGAPAHWLLYEDVDPDYLIDDFDQLRRAMGNSAQARIARPDMYPHLREMHLYNEGDVPLASPVAEGIRKVYVPMVEAPLGPLGDDFVEAFVARARTIGGFNEARLREIGQRIASGADSQELHMAAGQMPTALRPLTTWGSADPRLAEAAMATFEQLYGTRGTFGVLSVTDEAVQRSAGRMNVGLRSDTPNWQVADGFEVAPWRLIHTQPTEHGRRLVELDVEGEWWDELEFDDAMRAWDNPPAGTRRLHSSDRETWSEEIPAEGDHYFVDVPDGTDPELMAAIRQRAPEARPANEAYSDWRVQTQPGEMGLRQADPPRGVQRGLPSTSGPDAPPSTDEWLDVRSVAMGHELNPEYIRSLIDEPEAALEARRTGGSAGVVMDPDEGLPIVVRLPDGSTYFVNGHHRAVAQAAQSQGRFQARVLDVTDEGALRPRTHRPLAAPADRPGAVPPADVVEQYRPRRRPPGDQRPGVWGRQVSEGLPEIAALERVADGTVGESLDLLTTFNRQDLDDDVLHEIVEPLMRPNRVTEDDVGNRTLVPGYNFEHLVYGTSADRLPWESYGPVIATGRDSTWQKIVSEWFQGPVDQAIGSIVRKPMFLHLYGQQLRNSRGVADLFVDDAVRAAARTAAARYDLDDEALDQIALNSRHQDLDELLDDVTPGDVTVDAADAGAIRDFAAQRVHGLDLARENALNRSLQLAIPFIDDSRFRSQMQQYVGNFVPFMFAEEQFLKRWARSAVESPEMIRKAQLTMGGLRNVGVVRKDDQGEEVYVMPAAGAAAEFLSEAAAALPIFGDNVRIPYAIEMTGQVGYTLPGLGDQVGAPSVGPLIAAPLSYLSRHFPELDSVERLAVQRGADQPVWRYFVPSHGAKLWEAIYGDIDSGQLAGATTSAMLAMAANGQVPAETATQEEWEEYIDRARGQARFILGVRAIFGMNSPAAPAVRFESDELSTELNELIAAAPIEEASQAFLAAHPDADVGDLLAGTASATEQTFGGMGTPIEEGARWMDDHRDIVDAFPGAASWLMPDGGSEDTFSYRAYQQQLARGLRIRKAPEELLRDIYFRAASRDYFEARTRHEENMLVLVGPERSMAQQSWDRWRGAYFSQHPVFQAMLADPTRSQRRGQVVRELGTLAADPRGVVPAPMAELINRYEDYRSRTRLLRGDRRAGAQNRRMELTEEFRAFTEWHIRHNPTLQPLYMQLIEPDLMEIDEDAVSPGSLSEERTFA